MIQKIYIISSSQDGIVKLYIEITRYFKKVIKNISEPMECNIVFIKEIIGGSARSSQLGG